MRQRLLLIAAALLSAPAFAQPAAATPSTPIDQVTFQLAEYLRTKDEDHLAEAVNEAIQKAAIDHAFLEDVIRTAERARMDRQLGASANGGTALASKATVSGLFSMALESGAFQRSTEGTVTTVRVNGLRAARLLTSTRSPNCSILFRWCRSDEASPWRGLSFAASFDPSRADRAAEGAASAAPPPANPTAQPLLARAQESLLSLSVRYELWNRRQYNDLKYLQGFKKALADAKVTAAGAALSAAVEASWAEIIVAADYPAFRAEVVAQMKAAGDDMDKLEAIANKRAGTRVREWTSRPAAEGAASNAERLAAARRALATYRQTRDEALKEALFGKVLTLEYIYQRPADLPRFSSIRLIGGVPIGSYTTEGEAGMAGTAPAAEFTINAGFNIYNSRPTANTGRLRDAQMAMQLDRKIHEWKSLGQPVFTIAGYYQYMFENGVIQFNQKPVVPNTPIELPKPAIEVLNTKGSIGIVQAKLTIPLGGGVTFPVGVTWANRTELIKANDVRGQFGFLFDLDKLLATK